MTSGNVQHRSGGWRIFLTRSGVLLFLAAAASSAYLTRHCIAVANTAIQRDLDISEEQMGLVLAVFSAGYFFFQIPGGWLGNRLGARTAFPLISALWSLLTVVSAAATSLFPLLASRAAFGAAQAGLVPISAKVIGDWFPVQSRGLCSAVIGAAMSVGGVVAMGLTAYLMNSYDWRDIFRMYSIVGIVWAGAFYVFFRATPAEHPWLQTKKAHTGDDSPNAVNGGVAPNDAIGNPEPKELTQRELLVRIVTNRSIWAINAQSFFRAAGYGLFVTWFPAFLEYRFGVSASKAGALAMYPLACVIVGSLLGGVLVDLILKRTGNSWLSRSGVAFFSLVLCGVLTFFATVVATPTPFVVLMAGGSLFSGLANPPAWAATMDVAGRYTAMIMGAMNMAGTLGAFIMPIVLGYMIGDIKRSGGDWNLLIYFVAAIYFAGAVCWLAVDPKKTVDA